MSWRKCLLHLPILHIKTSEKIVSFPPFKISFFTATHSRNGADGGEENVDSGGMIPIPERQTLAISCKINFCLHDIRWMRKLCIYISSLIPRIFMLHALSQKE
jgi:hypothetical protein